eukprot:Pompholyxophrys_punicea_v1_NODE_1333_length_782_cov_6.723521.p1 type:complete len:163 gc:universal NODE_1333_length_782_cov_6.723521:97-585(+)
MIFFQIDRCCMPLFSREIQGIYDWRDESYYSRRKKFVLYHVSECVSAINQAESTGRCGNQTRRRLVWDEYIQTFSNFEFRRTYRLSKATFGELLRLIRPSLEPNPDMARLANSESREVSPELQLSAALRYFSGGSYLDIIRIHGIHVSTFYDIVWRVAVSTN